MSQLTRVEIRLLIFNQVDYSFGEELRQQPIEGRINIARALIVVALNVEVVPAGMSPSNIIVLSFFVKKENRISKTLAVCLPLQVEWLDAEALALDEEV